MTVLEMMKRDVNSVIGLTVEYDFGGSAPIVDTIVAANSRDYFASLDGIDTKCIVYGISFNGASFWTVDKTVKVVEDVALREHNDFWDKSA